MLLGSEGPIDLDRLGGGFGVLGALFSDSNRPSLLMASMISPDPVATMLLPSLPWLCSSPHARLMVTRVSFDFVRGSVLICAMELNKDGQMVNSAWVHLISLTS
jgi:hypothetical protein